jgi:hypothetical protein
MNPRLLGSAYVVTRPDGTPVCGLLFTGAGLQSVTWYQDRPGKE